MILGGLWWEDIQRLQREGRLIDYGVERDGYHYWAEVRP